MTGELRPLRPNGPTEPSPGLSAAMPWENRRPITSALKGRARRTPKLSSRGLAGTDFRTLLAPFQGALIGSCTAPQGIGLTPSALGWVLPAFQAGGVDTRVSHPTCKKLSCARAGRAGHLPLAGKNHDS